MTMTMIFTDHRKFEQKLIKEVSGLELENGTGSGTSLTKAANELKNKYPDYDLINFETGNDENVTFYLLDKKYYDSPLAFGGYRGD